MIFFFFFFFFAKKRLLTFHANCLLRDNLHEMSKPIFFFLQKKKHNFMILSAEMFTQQAKH